MDSILKNREELLTFAQAARTLPRLGGKSPHSSTLWRWTRRGIHDIRLEFVKSGRVMLTSAEALTRFQERVTEADTQRWAAKEPSRPRTVTRSKPLRNHQVARAKEDLKRAGF